MHLDTLKLSLAKLSPLKKALHMKKLSPVDREQLMLDGMTDGEREEYLAGKHKLPLNSVLGSDKGSKNKDDVCWTQVPEGKREALQSIYSSRAGPDGLSLDQFAPIMRAVEPNMGDGEIEEEFAAQVPPAKPGRRAKPIVPESAFASWAADLIGDLEKEDWESFRIAATKPEPPATMEKTAEQEAWDDLVQGQTTEVHVGRLLPMSNKV